MHQANGHNAPVLHTQRLSKSFRKYRNNNPHGGINQVIGSQSTDLETLPNNLADPGKGEVRRMSSLLDCLGKLIEVIAQQFAHDHEVLLEVEEVQHV